MPAQQRRPAGSHSKRHGPTGLADQGTGGGLEFPSHKLPSSHPVAAPSLLQPRVAVVLGVPDPWHRPLFACRLLSIAPAVWFGIPQILRVLHQLHAVLDAGLHPICSSPEDVPSPPQNTALVETMLAIIWCGASSYLSFFFTDCLMSRWLLNYTPQATIVRLLAVNALNGYLTSWVLYLAGSSEDARLLLPAWIAIAAILTAIYHTTQRKINIRKETSMSISVFSIASFTSMVCLLAQLHISRAEQYPAIPLVTYYRQSRFLVARLLDMDGFVHRGYG